MLRRSARLLLLVAVLTAASGAAAGNARADGPIVFHDFCKSVAPDAIVTLGPGVPEVKRVTYPPATYASDVCPRYVVDIVVPTTTSGGPGYFDEFSIAGGYYGPPVADGYCEQTDEYLRVYRKSAFGGEFTVVGGGRRTGTWNPGGGLVPPHCEFVEAPGYVDLPAYFSPPSLMSAVYRVAVAATALDGMFHTRVQVRAWHPAIVA